MDKKTLRRFYEATFESGLDSAAMSKLKVSFDEYFEFLRLHAPLATRRSAAENSFRADFQKLAQQFPPDPPEPESPDSEVAWIERKPRFDLGRLKNDPKNFGLSLDRVKNVSGWKSLRRLRSLDWLSVRLCDTGDPVPSKPRLRLRSVTVAGSSAACVGVVLASVDAAEVRIEAARAVLHLEVLASCRRLVDVSIAAKFVRGVSVLRGHPIEELTISDVELDDEFRETLQSLGPTLRRLFVCGPRPFAPAELGNFSKMKALRQVLVPCFRALRREWIEFAADHPKIGFDFFAFDPSTNAEAISVEEIHRKADIPRCVKGKKIAFEIAGDLAGRTGRYGGNNEDLEDALRPRAKAAKKKVDWHSESDTFIARAADVETLRWVIDQALG